MPIIRCLIIACALFTALGEHGHAAPADIGTTGTSPANLSEQPSVTALQLTHMSIRWDAAAQDAVVTAAMLTVVAMLIGLPGAKAQRPPAYDYGYGRIFSGISPPRRLA